MTKRTIPCPACGRGFADNQALHSHLKAKGGRDAEHGRAWTQHQRVRVRQRRAERAERDDEPSMADLAVEATIKRDSGQRLSDLEEGMLP